MPNNPYIELVKNHTKILTDTDQIYSNKSSWSKFFGDSNPLVLEIGTGLGNFFSSQVIDNPKKNFIGMEIRYKRLFKTAEKSLGNVKNNDNTQNSNPKSKVQKEIVGTRNNFVVLKDFGENIDKIFGAGELAETYVFFPDPWDKNDKTIKNRLVQKSFLENLYYTTKTGGKFIFKTDHMGYFDFVLDEIKTTNWKLEFKTYDYEKEGLYDKNKITEFEQIFRGQDIKVNYLELVK
ncbi:MAG: hypothetical protein PHH06_04815 [Candidatus Gracilibacteria bacterium]|nr:hypothetical protein [Candidatus Gracilibacteria bacterium]